MDCALLSEGLPAPRCREERARSFGWSLNEESFEETLGGRGERFRLEGLEWWCCLSWCQWSGEWARVEDREFPSLSRTGTRRSGERSRSDREGDLALDDRRSDFLASAKSSFSCWMSSVPRSRRMSMSRGGGDGGGERSLRSFRVRWEDDVSVLSLSCCLRGERSRFCDCLVMDGEREDSPQGLVGLALRGTFQFMSFLSLPLLFLD